MQRQWRIVGLGDYLNYYSYFTYGVLEGSIRCGAWFRPVPLFGQSLGAVEEQIKFMKPHILLCHMIFNRKPHDINQVFDMLRRIKGKGVKIFYHAGDARVSPRYPGNISDIVDGVLLNSGMIEQYQQVWKVPCYHWPYACLYQRAIGPRIKDFECGIAFTGALAENDPNHGPRTQFVQKLGDLVKIFPTPETGNTRMQTAEMAASADVILGYGMGEHIPLYLDVRPFQYIGAGAIYFHNESSAMDKFFRKGVHYISYRKDDVEQVKELYKKSKKSPELARMLRKQAFEFGQCYHSTQARVQFILDLVEGKVDKPTIYLEDLPC